MEALLGTSVAVFVGLTMIVFGVAAILTGRALGDHFRPAWQVAAACFGLALADRFLVYALFAGPLLHWPGLLTAYLVFLAYGLISWRITRVQRMVQQYPWKYRKSSPFTYVELEPRSR
jgi:ABC-type uncharacterized transport system permease subunit